MEEELNFITFEEEIKLDLLTFMYKMDKGMVPKYLQPPRRKEIHDYYTRNQEDMSTAQVKHNKMSIYLEGISKYNKLCNEIKSASSIKEFKKKARRQIIEDRSK